MRYEGPEGKSFADHLRAIWLRAWVPVAAIVACVFILSIIVVGSVQGLLVGGTVSLAGALIVALCVALGCSATLIHELGHLVAAWTAGFRVYRFVVYGFVLHARDPFKNYTSEFNSYVVAAKRKLTLFQLIYLYALGPIFNLLTAFGVWTVATDVMGINRDSPPFLFVLVFVLSNVWGAIDALAQTDGPFINEAISNPKEACLKAHRTAVFAEHILQRPRDYSDEDLMDVNAFSSRPVCLQHLTLFWRALDAGKIEEAGVEIAAAYEAAKVHEGDDPSVASLYYEMAMYSAWILNDRALSDEALALGDAVDLNDHNRLVALATREYVWGDRQEALRMAQDSLRDCLADLPVPALQESALEWYHRIFPELAAEPSSSGAN